VVAAAIEWLRRRITAWHLPENLGPAAEPATTRLNRRAIIVLGAVLVAVVLAAVATLVENSERLRAAQAVAPKPAAAPEARHQAAGRQTS